MSRRVSTVALLLLVMRAAVGAEVAANPPADAKPLHIVVLGDSITKGVREGVTREETFGAMVESSLRQQGISAEVINLGIGGERTDQAKARLAEVVSKQPQIVTVMYGTNDSYVDQGASTNRITAEAYRSNLREIAEELMRQGIEPVLMTEPRWADDAGPDGQGRNPNERLEPFMAACREVAAECGLRLIDHYSRWSEARAQGTNLRTWTTDGCHPNAVGHREMARLMLPQLVSLIEPPVRVGFETKLDTVLEHDDRRFLWYHPRAAVLPKRAGQAEPSVLMTLQKHLSASDHYSGLSTMLTNDLGKSWTEPKAIEELDWVREPSGVDVAVADVTPMHHEPSGKVIAVGAQVRYSAKGEQLEDQPLSNQTAYAVYDPETGRWTKWRRLEMPPTPEFNFARSACAQGVIDHDGSVLLPFYIGLTADKPYGVTVVRCRFEGDALTYAEHGNVLSLGEERGLYEPSLIRADGRFYLTIRNDLKGYVTWSKDGLRFRPIKAWTFDDGSELGSYNTQQHWLAKNDGLFLVYTRRGAGNDHIIRHRAPLFLAQVDPERLVVMRETERVLVSERGAELGNFGASAITPEESWVTVSEGVWDEEARRRGARGALFVARVMWQEEKASAPAIGLPRSRATLEAGELVRVVCFGDSVTGVYYHTGSRRAYSDMLAIALGRANPKAKIDVVNAGVSGNTTRDALARIERDVVDKKPTLVTVMFGLNDMTRVPIEEYQANLETIITRCRNAGAEVLLCTPNNVITTGDRPSERLVVYCDAVREVAKRMGVAVCDVYSELEGMKKRDAMDWRLLMSDAIHPNMDGHKRMAEMIGRTISGREIDLSEVPAPEPGLPQTAERLRKGEPIRVLAMAPFDKWIESAIEKAVPGAKVEVTSWAVEGKTLAELEQEAKGRVRPMKPDLVILAVPREACAESEEAFIHGQAWVMNSALNFGPGGWDCVAIHPSVTRPDAPAAREHDALVQRLVKAQDLPLLDRRVGDTRDAEALLREWIAKLLMTR